MIRYLYHISDIHVRMYARHDEYRHVFANLYRVLKENESGVIVITGDVLHNKIDLTPECCILVYEFLKRLGEIMPVIMIAGNHDALLNNRNRVDSLTSILHERTPENVYYFPKTGIYAFENLLFVINSLLDDSSWIFPHEAATERTESESIIALYHGQVGPWINHAGFKSQSFEKNLKDFEGADLVLLGDIHKHQYMDDVETIGYAGSLISQNFTETDDDHGVLIWDVLHKTSKMIRIENPYAFKHIYFDGNLLWIDEVSYHAKDIPLPSQGSIRIQMSQEHEKNRNILSVLTKRFPLVRLQTVYDKPEHTDNAVNVYHEDELADIQEYIIHRCKDCKHREAIVHDLCEYYHHYIATRHETADWHLLSLYFDNMFGYGEANRIEFSDFPMHTVTGIFGKNSTGKSTLIDIIIFMLYGKITRSVSGNSIPKEIIHYNETKSYGEVRIRIGKQIYQITKHCLRQKNDKIKIVEKLFEIRGDHVIELTDEQRRRTDKLIAEKIGNMDSFLFTNVMLQQREKSFRDMTQANKKDFLYHLFHLDGFDKLRKEKEDEMKKTKIKIDVYQKQMQGRTEEDYLKDLSDLDQRRVSLHEDILNIDRHIQDTTQEIEHLLTNIVPIILKTDLMAIDKKISAHVTMMENLRQEIHLMESTLQSMDISARRDTLKRLEGMQKPQSLSFKDQEFVDRYGPHNPDNTREKWDTEYERVMACIRDFENVKSQWLQKNDDYEKQLRLLQEQRPNVHGTCVPDEEWLRHLRTYDPEKIDRLTRDKEQLTTDHEKIDEETMEHQETKFRQIGALCSEWKIQESLYLMQSQTYREDQDIRYNPACAECMNNPYYIKKQDLEDRLRQMKKDKDALLYGIEKCIAEISEEERENECVIDFYERLQSEFIQRRKKFMMDKKRLETIYQELEQAEKERQWTTSQELLRQQKKIDIKINKMMKNWSTDEHKKKYDDILSLMNMIPVYHEMNRLWDYPSENQLRGLKEEIRLYEQSDMKRRDLQKQLDEKTCELQDAQIERIEVLKSLENQKMNHALQKEITSLRERKHDLQARLAVITDEMKSIVHQIQQKTMELENLSTLKTEWLQHIDEHNVLSTIVSIIERDGLPLYLLSKKIPRIEEDINMIVRPFMDKTICFQIQEKDIVLGSKGTNQTMVASSGFYGGMEAFILDVALKISFGRFGKLPRSDFFIIDEGVSVIDQERIINLSNLFDFLLSFNERVYIMSHLPIVKDFVQNRIEIEKDEKSSKSHLKIFY